MRYPLFSEDERSAMSQELTNSTGGVASGRLVDQLDVDCENEGAVGSGLTRGPFHVFTVSTHRSAISSVAQNLSLRTQEIDSARKEDNVDIGSTEESQSHACPSDETAEEIVHELMHDFDSGYHEFSSSMPGIAGFSDQVRGLPDVSSWDYTNNGLTRREYSSDSWARQQSWLPDATTYGIGLDPSDDTWADVCFTEFLKSPSPIPQVSLHHCWHGIIATAMANGMSCTS